MKSILAVLFDAGGTLLEPWPSVGHVYAKVAAEYGQTGIDPEALNRHFSRTWRTRHNFDYSRSAWRDLVAATFEGVGQRAPDAGCFNAIYERFTSAESWHVFDDVRPTLSALRHLGLKLAVVSNWDERLRPLLARLNLADCFDAIVVSHETGEPKPSPGLFHRATNLLAVEPAAALHIGDSRREDLEGAQLAGLRALHLDRRGVDSATVVSTLSALPKRLRPT